MDVITEDTINNANKFSSVPTQQKNANLSVAGVFG